jgi:hypothetical protein
VSVNARAERIARSRELAGRLAPRRSSRGPESDDDPVDPILVSDGERFREIVWALRLHSAGRTDLPPAVSRLPIVGSRPVRRIVLRIHNLLTRPERYRAGLLADALEILARDVLGRSGPR